MKKAILEFDISDWDGRRELQLALDGWRYKVVIENVLTELRNRVKYREDLPTETKEVLDEVRTLIFDTLHEEGLELE